MPLSSFLLITNIDITQRMLVARMGNELGRIVLGRGNI
jgi:hypothetical protein